MLLAPENALSLLLDLPFFERERGSIALGDDAKYWRIAAAVALETLVAQKVVPVMQPANQQKLIARWLPVLDSSREMQRLAFLEKNMPAVCRAEYPKEKTSQPPVSSRALLTSFLNTL